MSTLSTFQDEWKVLAEAAVNVENSINADVNTAYLAHSGTWATGAQNPAYAPRVEYLAKIQPETNGARLRFLVADTDNDQVTAIVWGWDDRNSAPLDLLTINPIQAGATICNTAPYKNLYTSTSQGLEYLRFTIGGTAEMQIGEIITGTTSTVTATVIKIELDPDSGTWPGDTASGTMYVAGASGAFTIAGETITGSASGSTITGIPHLSTPKTVGTGNSLIQVPFDTGVTAPVIAEVLTGGSGGAIATVDRVVVTSGSWDVGDAAGFVYVSSLTGNFQAETATGDVVGATLNPTGAEQYFRYADILTIGTDNASSTTVGTSGGDGILEVRFDLVGMTYLWCDFDCDLATTDGTNALCAWKGY